MAGPWRVPQQARHLMPACIPLPALQSALLERKGQELQSLYKTLRQSNAEQTKELTNVVTVLQQVRAQHVKRGCGGMPARR